MRRIMRTSRQTMRKAAHWASRRLAVGSQRFGYPPGFADTGGGIGRNDTGTAEASRCAARFRGAGSPGPVGRRLHAVAALRVRDAGGLPSLAGGARWSEPATPLLGRSEVGQGRVVVDGGAGAGAAR